jgi:hypothetical protein
MKSVAKLILKLVFKLLGEQWAKALEVINLQRGMNYSDYHIYADYAAKGD